MKKCRWCRRVLKPRGSSRPSVTDPSTCQNCADLAWALHGKRPEPERKVA